MAICLGRCKYPPSIMVSRLKGTPVMLIFKFFCQWYLLLVLGAVIIGKHLDLSPETKLFTKPVVQLPCS